MGRETWDMLLYTCIFAGVLAAGKLAVVFAKSHRKGMVVDQMKNMSEIRMHMSVPVLLGYMLYVTGGVQIGI